jgi:hypothetical protein
VKYFSSTKQAVFRSRSRETSDSLSGERPKSYECGCQECFTTLPKGEKSVLSCSLSGCGEGCALCHRPCGQTGRVRERRLPYCGRTTCVQLSHQAWRFSFSWGARIVISSLFGPIVAQNGTVCSSSRCHEVGADVWWIRWVRLC